MKAAALVAVTILLVGYFLTGVGPANAQEALLTSQLHVKYAGNTAEPYTVSLDSSSKYTLSQTYSWVRDEVSRYSLVAYSIDNGANIEIPRKARGSFSLDIPVDSDHTIVFLANIQYPMSAITDSEENLNILFSPSSPTGDEWFDAGSEVTITVSNRESSPETRQQIVSWSLDNSRRPIESDLESFTTPSIQVHSPHQVKFMSTTQYYVSVISEHGTVAGEGWYDAGSTATVSVSNDDELLITYNFDGWDESSGLLLEMSESFLVDSPKTLTTKWTADYSRLIALGAVPIAATGAIILLRRKSSKATEQRFSTVPAPVTNKLQQVSASPLLEFRQRSDATQETVAGQEGDHSRYAKEITGYALQKSVEKLEVLHSSGLVSDAKFTKVKEKLEQAFE